ncbi:hypothetical protein Scep_014655 [Stephania cephalantha]|uniref:Uncharacterized protein n=1 Tax=Stephania cephalantha TaxID=152367 RepID=A0AAP0J1N3_9MAGN
MYPQLTFTSQLFALNNPLVFNQSLSSTEQNQGNVTIWFSTKVYPKSSQR